MYDGQVGTTTSAPPKAPQPRNYANIMSLQSPNGPKVTVPDGRVTIGDYASSKDRSPSPRSRAPTALVSPVLGRVVCPDSGVKWCVRWTVGVVTSGWRGAAPPAIPGVDRRPTAASSCCARTLRRRLVDSVRRPLVR